MKDILARALSFNNKQSITSLYTIYPDPSGDSAPLINSKLQALSALGGGTLRLASGTFACNATITIPSFCSIIGSGKNSTVISKGTGFTAGNTLVDMSGNGSGGATGSGHTVGIGLQDLRIHGNNIAGLLLQASYSSIPYFQALRFSGAPATAMEMTETWDGVFVDLGFNNCGGTSGDSDAVIRILGSANDKSNLLRFFGCRIETFPNCAILIDNNGTNNHPYMINFTDIKLEASTLVSNATFFKSSQSSANISLRDVYCAADSGAAASATGIRVLDIDGNGHVVDNVLLAIGTGSNFPTLTSIVRVPRSNNLIGGYIRSIGAIGGTTLGCMVEVVSPNSSSNQVVYPGTLIIEDIKPFGSVPLLGGTGFDATTGVDQTGVIVKQLLNTPTPVLTSGFTFRRGHVNRILPYNNTSAANFTIPPESGSAIFGNIGDVITVSQENTGAGTIVPYSGVSLQIPSNLTATTSGQYTQVRARKIALNTWRIF